MATGDVFVLMLIQIREWLPPLYFLLCVNRGNVLGLWVLPVAWGGGCLGGLKF